MDFIVQSTGALNEYKSSRNCFENSYHGQVVQVHYPFADRPQLLEIEKLTPLTVFIARHRFLKRLCYHF